MRLQTRWPTALVVWSAALAGCGGLSYGDGDPSGSADAGADEDPSRPSRPDGGGEPVAPRCDPGKPFGAPVPIAGLNTGDFEQYPTLSADERVILFARAGDFPANMKIYMAERTDRALPFGPATRVPSLDVTNTDALHPTLTADGRSVFVQKNGGNTWDIESATRASVSAAFGPVSDAYDSGELDEYMPSVSPDGRTIYFQSYLSGMGDIYVATRSDLGAKFGPASPLPGVNVSNRLETAPVVSPDGLRIYFLRSDGVTSTWNVAERASTSAAFDMVRPFTTFPGFDLSWVSDDDCVFYMHGPPTSGTRSDLYVATRPE